LQEAVLCYRNEYRVERLFNRLKSRVHIAPLFVKRNEQIEGLTVSPQKFGAESSCPDGLP
jgi:transposase